MDGWLKCWEVGMGRGVCEITKDWLRGAEKNCHGARTRKKAIAVTKGDLDHFEQQSVCKDNRCVLVGVEAIPTSINMVVLL